MLLLFYHFALQRAELLIQSVNSFGFCNSHVEAVYHKTLIDERQNKVLYLLLELLLSNIVWLYVFLK